MFYPPGNVPNPDSHALDIEQARQILGDPSAAAELLGRLLPADLINPAERSVADSLDQNIIVEWISDEELTRLLFAYLSEEDYQPGVLKRLTGDSPGKRSEVLRVPCARGRTCHRL